MEGGWCAVHQPRPVVPEHRHWRRLHGLQPPLHPQQLLGWLFMAVLGAGAFLLIVPAVMPSLWPLLYSLLTSLFVLHAVAHFAALVLDPADPRLRKLKPTSTAVPEFDRTKHAHVIENGRCHLCNIETSGPRTKHCSVCNKCVGRFDHHCKWLNHCIGGRNYAAFLVCVVSAALACLLVVVLSVTVLICYHVDQTKLAIWYYSPFDGTEYEPHSFNMFALDAGVFLFLVGGVGCLAALAACLLLHLCIFHVYISYRGITTYEYIRNYRENTLNRALSTVHPKTSSTSSDSIFTVQSHLERNGTSGENRVSNDRKDVRGEGSIRRRAPGIEFCWRIFRRSHSRSSDAERRPRSQLRSKESYSLNHSSIETDNKSYPKPNQLKRTNTFPLETGAGSISDRVCRQKVVVTRKTCRGCRYCQMMKADPTLKEQIDAYKRKSARRRRRAGWYTGVCYGDEPVQGYGGKKNQIAPGERERPPRSCSLPALPPPTRRQVHTVSLKELSEVLHTVQNRPRPPRHKKTSPLSPTLSPIHESGLSNPSTPHITPRPQSSYRTRIESPLVVL